MKPSTNQVLSLPTFTAGRAFRCLQSTVVLACTLKFIAVAEPIPVHHPEGTLHGFLALTNERGKVLADGDLINIVHGNRVTAHLTFHFKDGSLDDETTIFTQHGVFRLISDHHIQRGPYFRQPLDMNIDVPKGIVVTRSAGKDGKEEIATEHIKLPPDLYNGLVTPVIKNIRPNVPETKISMIVATPKPRLITLAISPMPSEWLDLAGIPRKSLTYEIKVELGGIAALVAPIIGKQPPNLFMWIVGGEVPAFLRERGPIFEGGEILDITLIGPTWTRGGHEPPAK